MSDEIRSCRHLPDGPLVICSYNYLEKHGISASRSTLSRWEKSGNFPVRVRCSSHKIAWVRREIDEYLAELSARREAR